MVKRFIRQGSSLLLRRQTSILSAAVIMMILVLASRFLGLWRNWFLARYFGAAGSLDALNVAFVIPDLLTSVLITGALSVAFIPIFTKYVHKKEKEEGEILASSILNIALVVYAVISMVVFIFPKELNSLIAPGLDEKFAATAAELTRIIIFGEFFLVIGSFFTSVLQSHHRFVITALAPVAYNMGVLIGIIVFSRFFGIYGVGLGVVIGSIFHLSLQLFALNKLGFRYKSLVRLKNPDVIRVIKLSLPRALGVGVGQLEWAVNIILASTLITGSVAILKFSADLQNLPIGLFGLTVAAAALPTLSTEWSEKKVEDFKKTFLNSLFQMLFLAVPISVLLAVLRIPVVRLVLGSGLFDWPATVATATTLSYFAIGVFAQAGFVMVTRAFYAMHDTMTTLKVALVSLVFHIILAAYLIFVVAKGEPIPVAYLGLATSISGIFSFVILFALLARRLGGFKLADVVLPTVKIGIAALVMAVVLYIPLHWEVGPGEFFIDYIIDTTKVLNLLFLTTVVALFGFATYLFVSWWFKSHELKAYMRMLPNFRKTLNLLHLPEQVDGTGTVPKP